MNTICLTGRLTRDPELRYTQSNVPVASFAIAVPRPRTKDKTDFIDCFAWRSEAEFVSKWVHKGTKIEVTGVLQSRSYEDKDGKKHKVLEVNCNTVGFAESKKTESGDTGQNAAQEYPAASGSEFTELEDADGELPF